MPPDLRHEDEARETGARAIAGIDEVGRGPWAGPVTAAAVIWIGRPPEGLDDSKVLKPARRDALAPLIEAVSHHAIGEASAAEIDAHGIRDATFLAMRRAIDGLPVVPDHLLIDGTLMPPGLPCPARTIVRGDAVSASIAAASILAKTWRDRGMVSLAQRHPGYGWESNMGYGTRAHRDGLECHGVTPHHRRSFAPIRKMLCQAP